MKTGIGILKLADHQRVPDFDAKAAFFPDFTRKVVGQGSTGLDPAAGQAPKPVRLVTISVDQQEVVLKCDQATHGEAGRGLHTLYWAKSLCEATCPSYS